MAVYSAPIDAVAVSALQDVMSLLAGATYPFLLHELSFGQKTLTAVEGKEVRLRRATATVTQNGTSVTGVAMPPGASSASVTAKRNATTQSTSSGSITTIWGDVWMFLNGFFYLPAPEDREFFSINTAAIFDLPTAPSGSMTVSGRAKWEELGI